MTVNEENAIAAFVVYAMFITVWGFMYFSYYLFY